MADQSAISPFLGGKSVRQVKMLCTQTLTQKSWKIWRENDVSHRLWSVRYVMAPIMWDKSKCNTHVGSLKWYVSFAKEPYKRDDILQKRLRKLRSLLIVATAYTHRLWPKSHGSHSRWMTRRTDFGLRDMSRRRVCETSLGGKRFAKRKSRFWVLKADFCEVSSIYLKRSQLYILEYLKLTFAKSASNT